MNVAAIYTANAAASSENITVQAIFTPRFLMRTAEKIAAAAQIAKSTQATQNSIVKSPCFYFDHELEHRAHRRILQKSIFEHGAQTLGDALYKLNVCFDAVALLHKGPVALNRGGKDFAVVNHKMKLASRY